MPVNDVVSQQGVLRPPPTELELAFEAAPFGVALFDSELNLTRVNRRLAEWSGSAWPSGLSAGDVLPGEWPETKAFLRRALAGERLTAAVSSPEFGVRASVFHAQVSYAPLETEGQISGVIASVEDVTRLVEHDRELAAAYGQLEAVFDATDVGLITLDRDLRVVRFNDRVAERNGLDRATAMGRLLAELQPDVWPSVREHYERALDGERIQVEFDRRAHGQTQGPTHLAMSYTPLWHDDQVVGVAAVSADISARVEQQRALSEAYAQLEAVFDNVPVGIAVYDRELRALRMNERMANWNGLEARSAIGMHAAEFTSVLWSVVEPRYQHALNGLPTEVDLDRRVHGQVRGPEWLAASYRPVYIDGETVGVTVTATDITSHVEAKRRAEEQVRLRDDVIAIASHELRTPLTSIIGLSQYLERRCAAASIRDDLSMIRSESQRLARTLDRLLDLVGLSGTADVAREPLLIAPLVRRQIRMLCERHPALRVTEDIAEVPTVLSDEDRIAQILSNLFENAAKYAGEFAEVVACVRVDGDFVALDVADNGPGIPLDEQDHVFERRYRGRAQGQTEGLGLGLYLSHALASRLGGTLSLHSTPGDGSTFTLRLPLRS